MHRRPHRRRSLPVPRHGAECLLPRPGGFATVSVMFEGMKAQPATFSTSEGNTQFVFEGKTYFYTSDPGAAEMEVKHFKDQ